MNRIRPALPILALLAGTLTASQAVADPPGVGNAGSMAAGAAAAGAAIAAAGAAGQAGAQAGANAGANATGSAMGIHGGDVAGSAMSVHGGPGIPGGDIMINTVMTEAQRIAIAVANREVNLNNANNTVDTTKTALNTANNNYNRDAQNATDAKAARDRLEGTVDSNGNLKTSGLTPQDVIDLANTPGSTVADKVQNLKNARQADQDAAQTTADNTYKNEVRPAETARDNAVAERDRVRDSF